MKRNIEIPEYWEEMTQDQFEYLLKQVFVMMSRTDITKTDILYVFADYLCGRKRFINPSKNDDYNLLIDFISKNHLQWIFNTEGEEVIFNYDTTTNLLPTIGTKLIKYTGPLSHGSDLRFAEYRHACEYYNKYTVDHNVNDLNALVGILYRQKAKDTNKATFDGDYRVPFNKHHIGIYAKNMSSIPEYIKWGVYQWFGYFCYYLMTGVFIIEGNEVCFAPLFPKNRDQGAKQDESLGMTSVLFSLAESGTFGTIKETDNAFLVSDVMMKMLNDKQQIDKLKKIKK